MLAQRPRILVFDAPGLQGNAVPDCWQPDCEVVHAPSVGEGLALLRTEQFDGVYANPQDPAIWERAGSLLQADYILDVVGDGVALVHPDLRITWANTAFEKWCGGPVKGRTFYEALGSPNILGPDYCPFHTALAGKPVSTRLHCNDNRYVELSITPVCDTAGKVSQLISLTRDVTALVQQQQKLDALHQAGRQLAGLSAEQLAEMSLEERIELLKHNIRRFTHDLLHYDVIEIRLLDQASGKLEPLLEEGMTAEAAQRTLYARQEGNGVTGYVAATGKSYLCPDTTTDPLYIEGAQGARSSVTVPMMVGDQVIGTFNVESPQVGGFGEQDLQFCEIFSRELALALHTLELLTAEKRTTATQSVEAISREVALPVDEILASATAVLDRWIGIEPEMADRLKQILASARQIKQSILKVGEDMAPQTSKSAPAVKFHPKLKDLRVLVADNDERVRRSAHSILGGRFGCIVETARDGREALTMARLGSYDAVLTDIRLPDMSGYDIYCQLKAAQPRARVILMTGFGYDPGHSIVKCRQEGLRHILYKPFRVDQLLDALESADAPAGGPAPGAPPAPAAVNA
jgi:CheY-like chemotaxis protein/putative methionine-R-sulfoxide reductase with GAF domain